MQTELDRYPKPSVTVDCVIFGYAEGQLSILLVQRDEAPFAGSWTLPGGFLNLDESCAEAARRVLSTKTNIENVFLEQLYTFDEPGRDPRGRVLSIAHYALVNAEHYALAAGKSTRDVRWWPWEKLPELGFDHAAIIAKAIDRLRSKVLWQPIGFELLSPPFTMPELQSLYECILKTTFDRRNFHKRIMGLGILQHVGVRRANERRRPADLFVFDETQYKNLLKNGLEFKI
jgi:8-oxo-dGTP diphosphatase